MLKTLTQRLDRRIATLQKARQQTAECLALLESLDQEAVAELADTLRQLSELVQQEVRAEPPAKERTQFERITEHLLAADRPQTIAEIAKAMGISRSSVAVVLYRTHRQDFVGAEMPKGCGRAKVWESRQDPRSHFGDDPPF